MYQPTMLDLAVDLLKGLPEPAWVNVNAIYLELLERHPLVFQASEGRESPLSTLSTRLLGDSKWKRGTLAHRDGDYYALRAWGSPVLTIESKGDLIQHVQIPSHGPKVLAALSPSFIVGKTYNRQKDLHDRYGGSRQSGICPSSTQPLVFLFTGGIGERFGYKDSWDESGEVFQYVGDGQIGDMEFVRGNKVIRDHLADGRQLLLFEGDGKGRATFVGEFLCVGYRFASGPDREGKIRRLIIFDLRRVEDEPADYPAQDPSEDLATIGVSLVELQARILTSPAAFKASDAKLVTKRFLQRSAMAARYIRLRAGGKCEGCGENAPFLTKAGEPYLEAHHIRRKADNGLDHPAWMVGICPTCHRRVHHADDGDEYNRYLRDVALERETTVSKSK